MGARPSRAGPQIVIRAPAGYMQGKVPSGIRNGISWFGVSGGLVEGSFSRFSCFQASHRIQSWISAHDNFPNSQQIDAMRDSCGSKHEFQQLPFPHESLEPLVLSPSPFPAPSEKPDAKCQGGGRDEGWSWGLALLPRKKRGGRSRPSRCSS